MDRQIITVDIAPGSLPTQRLRVSQGDVGRPLGVQITQNGQLMDCSGYSAHLYVLKPDKNYYEGVCTVSGSLITWSTAEQETPIAGECLAEIRISKSGVNVGVACFAEYVEASPADLGYASESLISSMTEYVDAAQHAAEEAEQVVEDNDNVNDVAVDSSGHIVLYKVLGGQVVSDETVPLFVDLVPETTCATIPQAVEAVWSRFPYGRVFVGNVTVNGIKRYICGFRRLGAAGVVIGFSEDGTGVIVTNINGTFTNRVIGTTDNALIDRGNVTISNADDIKNLSPGMYRIAAASTNVFPYGYGILIITKANAYSVALFIPVNSSLYDSVYRRAWNNANNTWYEPDWVSVPKPLTTGTIAKSTSISSGTMDANVCKRVGNIVTVSARLYGISEAATGTFFVIPDGFRPSYDIFVTGIVVVDGVAIPTIVHVYPNGNVGWVYSASKIASQVFFSATYPIQ